MKPFTAAQLLKSLAIGLAVWAVVAVGCVMVGSTGDFGWPAKEALGFRVESVLIRSGTPRR